MLDFLYLGSYFALTLLRNLDHYLAPAIPATKRLECCRYTFEADVLLIRKGSASIFALANEIEDAIPYLVLHFWFVDGIGAPVETDNTDVLEENAVRGHFLDFAGCEADDEKAAVPCDALHALRDEAYGIVDNVYTATLGSQFLDLFRPVRLAVVDGVVGAKGARYILLMLCAGCRDDGSTECFRDLNGRETNTACCCVDEDPVALKVSMSATALSHSLFPELLFCKGRHTFFDTCTHDKASV